MESGLSGKRALVTGAGKSLGREIAKSLLKCGAVTYALSRTQEHLDSLKKECPSIYIVCVDLSDWEATRRAVEEIGPIDLLVNNAAVADVKPFFEFTEDDIDRVYNVNVKGVFNVCQVVCKGMVDRKTGGAVVNVSSITSTMAFPGFAAYSSSKGAVDTLGKVMALELGPHKIRVNTVNPTAIRNTGGAKSFFAHAPAVEALLARTPLGKAAEIGEVVDAVLFLLSDRAAMIHGCCLPVCGGYTAC